MIKVLKANNSCHVLAKSCVKKCVERYKNRDIDTKMARSSRLLFQRRWQNGAFESI